MNPDVANRSESAVAMLRRMTQPRVAEEQCEFCSVPIASSHRHLLEVGKRHILCVCDPCALRFEAVVGGRFKLIPRNVRRLSDFRLEDRQWDDFALPIDLAFLYNDTPGAKMTFLYPSPAGAVESLLPARNWKELEAENPVLAEMQSDVEALLMNRVGGAREYFIIPIDVCYQLVGLIRMHWRGLSGGEKVWREVANFFSNLSHA
ncbi:MAG TPA: DUF5947 family protein [Verrucomicrobiae bacterium]|jgi:hypothetical protein|nr:DUF5947 family protein [Verrucomicrobiae bacterium]